MTLTRLVSFASALSLLAGSVAPLMASAATTSAFNSGELIKGSLSTVYYFASNGKRYVFPNEKTYFTWYQDFSNVKQIPDGQLSTIPLGGNVTYRPGRKMVKITTDPRVYVVDQGGVLRHVGSEQLAQTLYGISWKNQIDDVPDGYFTNYRTGTAIQTASDYQPNNVMTQTVRINQDKQLDETKVMVTIGSMNNGFVPTTLTIKRGTEVTWTNGDVMDHSVKGANFDSGLIRPGATFSRTFDTVGSFDYRCTVHPTMQGTINVVP
jgi:plastocyanin